MRALGLALLSTLCTHGCVIPHDFDYGESQNLPPSVVGAEPTPLDRVVEVIVDEGVDDPDAGLGSSDVLFRAIIREPNVGDNVDWNVFVNLNEAAVPPTAPLLGGVATREPDSPFERRVEFRLARSSFAPRRCHRVELRASRGFAPAPNFHRPLVDNDLGVGVWWIAARNMDDEVVNMRECP